MVHSCSLRKVDYLDDDPIFVEQHMLRYRSHLAYPGTDPTRWHNTLLDGRQHENLFKTLPPSAVLTRTTQASRLGGTAPRGLPGSELLPEYFPPRIRCVLVVMLPRPAHRASTMSWWRTTTQCHPYMHTLGPLSLVVLLSGVYPPRSISYDLPDSKTLLLGSYPSGKYQMSRTKPSLRHNVDINKLNDMCVKVHNRTFL